MLQTLLNNYGWILGLGGIGAGLLSWSLGLPALLRIVSSIIDALSPLVKAVMEILVSGLKDILDSIPTVLTVIFFCFSVYVYDKINYTREHNHIVNRLQVCEFDLAKRTKTKPPKEAPMWELPFRFPF